MRQFKYFTASWCGPCQTYGPIIETIDKEYDDVEITKMDIEKIPESTEEHGIFSIPTVIELDEAGKEIARITGAYDYSQTIEKLGLN